MNPKHLFIFLSLIAFHARATADEDALFNPRPFDRDLAVALCKKAHYPDMDSGLWQCVAGAYIWSKLR